jgi:hypothetical protein
VISPGTAAPADDDPVTPAVGVACDACHGPRAKLKSRCHFSLVSKVNQTTPPQAAGMPFEKSYADRSKLRGIRPIAIKKSLVVRRAKSNARDTGSTAYVVVMQKLRRSIALFFNTVAYRIIVNHTHKRRNDSSVRNDRYSENRHDRAVIHYRPG